MKFAFNQDGVGSFVLLASGEVVSRKMSDVLFIGVLEKECRCAARRRRRRIRSSSVSQVESYIGPRVFSKAPNYVVVCETRFSNDFVQRKRHPLV